MVVFVRFHIDALDILVGVGVIREAVAVGMKAQEQGVATKPATREQLREMAKTMINGARDSHDALVKAGCIPVAPV